MAISIIGQHDVHNFQQLKESNNSDGISVGTSNALVGVYGKVVAQQSLPTTVTSDTSGASHATAINALIAVLKNFGIGK
jgi:hypothetical protein